MATSLGKKLWTPSPERQALTRLYSFSTWACSKTGSSFSNYDSLYRWSISNPVVFWQLLQEFLQVRWQQPPQAEGQLPLKPNMIGAKWFPDATLNYAENLLGVPDEREAIVSFTEGVDTPKRWTRLELWNAVALVADALKKSGVGRGDRVAGVISNVPEAIIAMLGTASVGAVWCSSSPDFGPQAIVDRLAQVAPKVVFFTRRYFYAQKLVDCMPTLESCLAHLPSVKKVVLVDHLEGSCEPSRTLGSSLATNTVSWSKFLGDCPQTQKTPRTLCFEPCFFDDPLFILFSSGTTGVPKCIVHGVGGTLLQHKKELALHSDIRPGDRLMYFTTCGWMMWNWMVSALSLDATLALYDGAPHVPSPKVLWDVVASEKITAFGTSPKYLATCQAAGLRPHATHDLTALRTVLSTGSPLLPEHFSWVYEAVKTDVHLASISGGTDIVSCFMLGVPTEPVYSGEIQRPGLGMAVEAWSESGQVVPAGEKGELVCTVPFVSMPVGFWNDKDGAKYQNAYFTFFLNHPRGIVWRHGDFIAFTANGGIVVYGRSDATLNPGGVRIGTAELYRVVETHQGVLDSVAVAVPAKDGDVEIVLFLKMKDSHRADEEFCLGLRKRIRQSLSPRHVPAKLLSVKDIPYTRSGKKMELAVLNAFLGNEVAQIAAVANPESLTEFQMLGRTHAK